MVLSLLRSPVRDPGPSVFKISLRESYDFTSAWAIKQTHRQTAVWWLPEGRGWGSSQEEREPKE